MGQEAEVAEPLILLKNVMLRRFGILHCYQGVILVGTDL